MKKKRSTILMWVIFSGLVAGSLALAAKKPEKIFVLAERSMPYGREQVTLTFQGDQAEYITNSNFLEEPGTDAQLGYFRSKVTRNLEIEKKELEQIALRLPPAAKKGKNLHHKLVVSVNGKPVPEESPYYSGLLDLLTRALDLGEWNAVDGLKVSRNEGQLSAEHSGKPLKKRRPKKDRCREETEFRLRCELDGYGIVYFAGAKPSAP